MMTMTTGKEGTNVVYESGIAVAGTRSSSPSPVPSEARVLQSWPKLLIGTRTTLFGVPSTTGNQHVFSYAYYRIVHYNMNTGVEARVLNHTTTFLLRVEL
jgi:hypothetical protein